VDVAIEALGKRGDVLKVALHPGMAAGEARPTMAALGAAKEQC